MRSILLTLLTAFSPLLGAPAAAQAVRGVQALATGTREAARFLGTSADFGTVETGRRADLILLEGDPLANVANLQRRTGVMIGGRWLPDAEIRTGLAAIAARRSQ